MPGAQKAKLHRAAGSPERFHEVVVDVFRLRVPDFFLMDAVVGMEGNGPASPDLRDVGLILASDNAVALDAVMAALMGLDPGRLRFLRKATEDGLGDHELKQIEVVGELKPLPGFKVPPLGGEAIMQNETIQTMIHQKAVLKPQANPEWCTGCGTCIEQCPTAALALKDGVPEADPDLCISCFCCQEICPEKAITLS